ncbi:MAG: cytochrome-c peroxidase [Deltaproteobacteria bacterium]|nr:cytochrome-c peroxidase [Deltaproteobacteria bacterium]
MRDWLVLGFCLCVVAGCDSSSSDPGSETDQALRRLIQENGLTGDPADGLELPSIDDPVAVLGRKLFFSKSLGGDRDSACVSCHHPVLGGGDGLALSIGAGAVDPDLLGPGRAHPDGDLTVPRNAPTTFNLALWEKGLFWDSRVENLADGGIRTPDSAYGTVDAEAGDSISEAQSRFPVTSPEEMRGFEFVADGSNAELRTALESRLTEDGRWAPEFEAAFESSEITYGRIAEAMGAYEDSQVFTNTAWRAYVRGDHDAIGEPAKRGALLFFRPVEDGGTNCANCHAGDFFTDEDFHSVGAPQIGRGKGDGLKGTNDYGRARETADRNERFSFRTPTLTNVSATGPYLHSGAYDNLADVVRHHLDPQAALDRFDPASVPLAASEDFDQNKEEMLDFLEVSGEAIEFFDLVAFLETLTDPCVLDRACLTPWIADPATDDVDEQLLVAVDQEGNPL